MDIDDDAMFSLLRSSRERIRQSREMQADLRDHILTTLDLIRQSEAILRNRESLASLKFHQIQPDIHSR